MPDLSAYIARIPGDSEEEIRKWIESRKRNFPTKARKEAKQRVLAEARQRGQLVGGDKQHFGNGEKEKEQPPRTKRIRIEEDEVRGEVAMPTSQCDSGSGMAEERKADTVTGTLVGTLGAVVEANPTIIRNNDGNGNQANDTCSTAPHPNTVDSNGQQRAKTEADVNCHPSDPKTMAPSIETATNATTNKILATIDNKDRERDAMATMATTQCTRKPSTRNCVYFLRGRCRNGSNCRFLHDPNEKTKHDLQRKEKKSKRNKQRHQNQGGANGGGGNSIRGHQRRGEHRGGLFLPKPELNLFDKLVSDQRRARMDRILQCLRYLVQTDFLVKSPVQGTTTASAKSEQDDAKGNSSVGDVDATSISTSAMEPLTTK
eukprot:jgi/Bigna1/90686/estExt_fgenesh1_pg.C_760086